MSTTDLLSPVGALPIPVVSPVRKGQSRWLRAGRKLLGWAISVVILLGTWWLFLIVFHIDHFIGKTPLDVWHFVTAKSTASAPMSSPTRGNLYPAARTTLRDAFVGLGAGTLAALVCSVVFNLRRSVEQTIMPIAMVLRSVPLVAMTPLITLIFGRGLMCVTVIAGIVTFFPTLVNVTLALRATPQASIDLFRAYGAGPFKTMRKAQFPNALPAVFASLRIAAPLALVGALLAEWLATGKGLGSLMLLSSPAGNYNMLWTAAVLITAFSMVLYTTISGIERLVLARFADTPT
jgi:ABC-type nitrate/sulfonate/bicarbonate transport system permease component